MIAVRFFWLVWSDVVGKSVLANRFVGSILGLVVSDILAYTGAWINLWLLFGGSNQLLAGLALSLVTIYLAKVKKPTIYTLGPAIFMIVTCEAALIFESVKFFRAVALGKPFVKGPLVNYPTIAKGLNAIFGVFGLVLFVLGLMIAIDAYRAYKKYKQESGA